MNKKVITLCAAALLLGSPVFNVAYAAQPVTTGYVAAEATVVLGNGVKFYLGTAATTLVDVEDVSSTDFVTYDNVTDISGAALFEVRNFQPTENGATFELWVNGKQFVTKANGEASTSKAEAVCKTFTVDKKTLDFTGVYTTTLPSVMIGGSANLTLKAFVKPVEKTTADLNATLSNKGFAFSFPSAISQPESNPFASQMIAIPATKITGKANIGSVSDVMFFVLANDKGKALAEASTATSEMVKEATFVVVNPTKNYQITSLTAENGEGFELTTVAGEKINTDNNAEKGEIASVNAQFCVYEMAPETAPGEYTIYIGSAKVNAGDEENTNATDLYVGAYSLTAGGIKTYITTVAEAKKSSLSLAQTSNNTWAQASDILKANDARIVNIQFGGTIPSASEAVNSLYGKYLVPAYDASNYKATVYAPENVDLNLPISQWVLTAASGHNFTFTNRETNVSMTVNLYKTNKAGEYQIATGGATFTTVATNVEGVSGSLNTPSAWAGQIIRISDAASSEGFLTLTDAQLKQQGELVFNGEGAITVEDLYMAKGSSAYGATNDASKSVKWSFEKSDAVKNVIKYAYLNGSEVVTKDSAMVNVASYILFDKTVSADAKYLGATFSTTLEEKATAQKYVFKKNVNGSLEMMPVTISGADDAAKYQSVVKKDAKKVSVTTTNAAFATTVNVGSDAAYSDVYVDFNTLNVSLEAASKHVTLDSEEGSVAMQVNKNGVTEGYTTSEGLVFWLDTADVEKEIPSFYISKGIENTENRMFLYYAADSMYHWNDASASYVYDAKYALEGTYTDPNNLSSAEVKAVFHAAQLVDSDTIKTVVDGAAVTVTEKPEEGVSVAGLNNYKFNILKYAEDLYVVQPLNTTEYLYSLNGKLGFTGDLEKAIKLNVNSAEAPTSNEGVVASEVKVIANNGSIVVKNAAGKNVVVSTILGQVVANEVLTSDNATINVPAGIVVVAVEGESFKVNVK